MSKDVHNNLDGPKDTEESRQSNRSDQLESIPAITLFSPAPENQHRESSSPQDEHYDNDSGISVLRSVLTTQSENTQANTALQKKASSLGRLREMLSTPSKREYRILPLLLGCVILVSIFVNVFSVTSDWVWLTGFDEKTGQLIKNKYIPLPHWLTGTSVTALGFGIICDICILFRFFERYVWPSIVLALIAETFQDIFCVVSVISFSIHYHTSKGYIYKEGFWAMVAATILSFISTALMSIDLHRTPTLQLQDSGLTQKQRILLASVMLLCLYLTLGALIIYYIEHLNYLDSLYVYFCMATITTIGYGDIAPDTPGSRVFVVFYAVGGMVLLGLFVKSIHYVIIEEQQGRFMVLAKAREKKRNERRLNNKQRRMQEIQMREIKSGEGHRPHILQHIHGHLELPSIFRHASHASGDDRSKRAGAEERGGQSSVPALPQNLYEDESTEISEGGVQRAIHENHGSGITANPTKSHSRPTNFIKSWWYRFPCNRGTQEKPEETHHKLTRREQKAKETEEAYRETMREYYLRLQISSALFVLFWIVGALIFRGTESWGFGSAMYFMVITFTTLGYGDYSPKTKAGKIMFLVYVLLGVVMFTWLASLISDILSNKMKSHAVKVELDKRARLISGAGLDLDLEEGKPQDKSDDDDPESLAQLVEAIDAIIEPIPTEEVSGDCIYRLIKDIKEFDLILQKVLGVDHPRHLPDPSSDSLASSSHTHVQNKNGTVTISAAQWQHIVDYSGRLITLTEVLELVLQKLTDWEISEDQRRLERQQVYLRRKRFMKNRRKQLHEYEATHGLSNSEVENEVDELDDLYDDEIMNEIMEELMVRRRSSLATDFLGSSRMLRALGNRRSSFPTTRSDYNEDDRNNNDPSSLLRKAMRANPNVLHPLSLLMHLQSFKRRAGQKKKTERSIDRTILEQDMEDIERRMNRIGSDGHSSQYATTQGRLGEVSTSNALPIGHHPQHSTSM